MKKAIVSSSTSNPPALPKGYTKGPWYAGKVQKDEYGCDCVSIGTHEAIEHYEDTICEVWGTEHNAEANARLIVNAVNELLAQSKRDKKQ